MHAASAAINNDKFDFILLVMCHFQRFFTNRSHCLEVHFHVNPTILREPQSRASPEGPTLFTTPFRSYVSVRSVHLSLIKTEKTKIKNVRIIS